MTSSHQSFQLGAIVFPAIDQADVTGPFEVLSRIPGSRFHILSKDLSSVRDVHGFIITPEKTLADAPQLDVAVVPGGSGQEAVMNDEAILEFIREQAKSAKYVFSVCTGALICGAAGLLRGTKATTHWSAFHLLEYFGAIPNILIEIQVWNSSDDKHVRRKSLQSLGHTSDEFGQLKTSKGARDSNECVDRGW